MVQAEKSKQEARAKDESVRRLEEKLQAAEAKLKAKEQTCQAQSEKVCSHYSQTPTLESFPVTESPCRVLVVSFLNVFLF